MPAKRHGLAAVLLAAATGAAAQAQQPARYEPSERLRTALEGTCMADEVMRDAWCVKKCQADFRLDIKVRPPVCIATKPNAKYVPPKPGYQTREGKKGKPGD